MNVRPEYKRAHHLAVGLLLALTALCGCAKGGAGNGSPSLSATPTPAPTDETASDVPTKLKPTCSPSGFCHFGFTWANRNISFSYMPDGTIARDGTPSQLVAQFNHRFSGVSETPRAVWQEEFARAFQTWASVANLNFHEVPDSGAPWGTEGSLQGDPRFGDIRLGGTQLGVGHIGVTELPDRSGTGAGDLLLNAFLPGWYASPYSSAPQPGQDVYSVALHEIGHALGLAHSTADNVMSPTYNTVVTRLGPGDIAGIQALFGARPPDEFDAKASNETPRTAPLLEWDSGNSISIVGDLSTATDRDYYKVVLPANSTGILTVTLDSTALSLSRPQLEISVASNSILGYTPLYTGTWAPLSTKTLTGLTPGGTYFIGAFAINSPFAAGLYRLSIRTGVD